MNYGEFHCPKCSERGMGDYKCYESKILNDGQKHWVFYNIEKESGGWLCWALLHTCGVKVKHWWDPWGCCFNPCKVARTKVTIYEDSYGNKYKEESYCEHFCYCFLFLMVCSFLYMVYFTFFIWYDIYYAFCHKKRVKIMCTGNGERKEDDNDLYWDSITDFTFTENWWMNFPDLFVCSKCAYRGNSFIDFVEPGHKNVEIVNTQADVTNAGINNNI